MSASTSIYTTPMFWERLWRTSGIQFVILFHIAETRRYLRDFAASLERTSTAMELYQTMLALHPNRVNPGSLWAAAKASKPT